MSTSKPIPFAKLKRSVKARRALVPAPELSQAQSVFVAGAGACLRSFGVTEVEPPVRGRNGLFRVDIDVGGRTLGEHAFPPGMAATRLGPRRKRLREADHGERLAGYVPDHLALRPIPRQLAKSARVPARYASLLERDPKTRWATTVFPPENRYTFSDTAFPWSTCGRLDGAGGIASGVMVGPRHILTVSHGIQWLAPPSPFAAGWIRFTPSYFDGSAPFGVANGIHIYWQQQVDPPTIDGTEAQFDYVVVVLDRRMGDLTGWMGSRTYSDSWDGGNFWSHIGYPGDLAALQRPSFEGGFSLNGDDNQPASHQAMYHTADVWPGQSGGPMFGWWSGEPWPRTVAVQSWQNATTNGASGGGDLVDLIIRARNDFP